MTPADREGSSAHMDETEKVLRLSPLGAPRLSLLHATLYAARRRVIPILITTFTTIAGLMSLATGLGGRSLIWGPVATAIVWGLGFSTLLTLFVIPLLYRMFMGSRRRDDA